MPNVVIDEGEKNTLKLTFTVSQEEALPYLEEAALRLSEKTSIPGFRPGKAGYDVIKGRVGEMKIYEEALDSIVRKSFKKAILSNDIEMVGSPKIDVTKLAPKNDIEFTAEITLMPNVIDVADFDNLSIETKPVKVRDKDIDLAIRDLARMQTKESRAVSGSAASETDKVVISMNMKKDHVPVEGGQSPNHAVYMNEDYYIPGLKNEIKGMKEGEEKTFMLPFPKDHVQTMLAGSDVEFDVKVKEIFNLHLPEIDKTFANSLGMKDVDALKTALRENMQKEKDSEENFRQEKKMLELLASKSRFEDIPEVLINDEVDKMIDELQHGVEEQGLDFSQYLTNINKTIGQLKVDLAGQALTRIKVALLMRTIAKDEVITLEEREIDDEIDQLASHYKEEEAKKQVFSPQYREYTEHMLKNKKVIKLLRDAMIKSDG